MSRKRDGIPPSLFHERTAKWLNRLDAAPHRPVWHNFGKHGFMFMTTKASSAIEHGSGVGVRRLEYIERETAGADS